MRRVTTSALTRRFVLSALLASALASGGCLYDGHHHHGDWYRWDDGHHRDWDGRHDGRSWRFWNGGGYDAHRWRSGERH
jgi:hypothetical protein